MTRKPQTHLLVHAALISAYVYCALPMTCQAGTATVPLPAAPDLTVKGLSPEELKIIEQEAARQAQKAKSLDASKMGPSAPPTSPAGPSLPPSTPEKKPENEPQNKPLRSGSKTYSSQSYKSYTLKPGYAIQSTPAERAFGK